MHSSPIASVPVRAGAGLSYLVISAGLLGTGGLIGNLLSRDIGLSSVAVAAYRLVIGGTLIVLLLALTHRGLPRGRRAWTRIAVVGALAATYQASYFAAVNLTSVSLATLVAIGATPVLVVTVEAATGRRRPDRWMALTLGCALTGLALLVGLPQGGPTGAALFAGVGLALVAAAGFATVTIVGSVPVPGLDALSTTGFAFTVGGLGLAQVVAVAGGGLRFDLSPTAVALLVALAVGPTAVAYTLYFRGLRTVAASTAAVVMVVEPLTGAGLAAVVLHDRLGLTGAAGAVLLAVAVILAARPGAAVYAGTPYKRFLLNRGSLPTGNQAGSAHEEQRGGGERPRPSP